MEGLDNIRQLLQIQANAVTNKALKIPFETTDSSMLPKKKRITSITITPPKVITIFAINPLLLQIDKEDLSKMISVSKGGFHPEAPELFQKYAKLIIEIISYCIHNREGKYPDWMPEFLAKNCTWEDLLIFLRESLSRMGSQSFYNSITMLANVSPMEEAEMIALQKNQESWKTNLKHQ